MGVKSEISRVRVRVTFFNASSRHVDIFWVDFNGKIVRYFHRAPPQSLKKILTYVTHPWVALDSDTGQKLCLSGEEVYVTKLPPRENVEEDEETEDDMPTVNIRIHIPGKLVLQFRHSALQLVHAGTCN
ncbi:hypothetical protein BaRGS_00026879 [Batillaria attramentaria]|uniref:von Hippel-Lindau disease tumour suppressor beta domain-containing protein n=1 Tax=Batillaria attramentaria TaxID=370345 RepID=A0ABD0K4G4_9CAEN